MTTKPKREELISFAKTLVTFLLATGFKRALTSMMALGAALLGLSWVDVAAGVLRRLGVAMEPRQADSLAQLVGIAMIVTGFGGHVALFFHEEREKRRAADELQRAAQRREREAASVLVGRLRNVITAYADPSLEKDSGYGLSGIIKTHEAVKAFLALGPPRFRADRTLNAIDDLSFDASQAKSFYGIETAELEDLVGRLREHYEIE